MSTASEARVRDVVLGHLATELAELGVDAASVDDDFDLLGSGVLDSFGLLELIAAVELTVGVPLDFEHLDVGSLTVVGPLARHVAAQVEAAAGAADVPAPARPEPVAERPVAVSPPTGRRMTSVRRAAGSGFGGLHRAFVRSRDKGFSLAIAGSFASYGSHTVLQPPVRLRGAERIALGSGIFVGGGSWLQVLEESEAPVAIEIGDGTSFAGLAVVSAVASIRIGRRVSFARSVYVADHAHAYDRSSLPVMEQGITDIRSVEIGDGAWLGQNVVILPGSRIGEGAVVAANSVVHGVVPARSLAIGSPARILRRFGTLDGDTAA